MITDLLEWFKEMKNIDFQKIIEWLSFMLRCPVCAYKYNLERTKIIDTKQGDPNQANLLVHSDCGQCKSSVVFSVSINGPDVYSTAMITDLTSSDTKKFANQVPLSTDDIINVHQFLKEFDGDLIRVLT